jgi:hypothetical protein
MLSWYCFQIFSSPLVTIPVTPMITGMVWWCCCCCCRRRRRTSVNKVVGNGRGWITGGDRVFTLRHHLRSILGQTYPPIQWVPGAHSPRVKWKEHEADYSAPSNVEVKHAWSFTSKASVRLHAVVLLAQRQLCIFF